jgi:predicted dehydrogenase
MTTLMFYDPGHFHAALTLKCANPRIAPEVHVFAAPGPDRDAFVALIESFNTRDVEPTAWQLQVHESPDPLQALLDRRPGDAVVLAGRNQHKLTTIAALNSTGIPVLADKPWLVHPHAAAHLQRLARSDVLAMDIMTARYDPIAQLRHEVVVTEAVFGGFQTDGELPAIEIGSRHHLFKQVNGAALRRPVWYFDTDIQGDGLSDLHSHMIDQAQWLTADLPVSEYTSEAEIVATKRWATEVSPELFEEITGTRVFPAALLPRLRDSVLHYACNGRIDFRINGVRARTQAEWGQREPAGTGDLHHALMRGRLAELRLEHGPHTNFAMELELHGSGHADLEGAVQASMTQWRERFPGLSYTREGGGIRLQLPAHLRTTHESHFAMVLNEFLDYLDAGTWPRELSTRIAERYGLIAKALTRAGSDL